MKTVNEPFPAVNFGACFSKMFLDRIANPDTFAPLKALERYQEAQAVYSLIHREIFDKDQAADQNTVQKLINALHSIQDLEMQYFYRLGIQEGVAMHKPDFLTVGVG